MGLHRIIVDIFLFVIGGGFGAFGWAFFCSQWREGKSADDRQANAVMAFMGAIVSFFIVGIVSVWVWNHTK